MTVAPSSPSVRPFVAHQLADAVRTEGTNSVAAPSTGAGIEIGRNAQIQEGATEPLYSFIVQLPLEKDGRYTASEAISFKPMLEELLASHPDPKDGHYSCKQAGRYVVCVTEAKAMELRGLGMRVAPNAKVTTLPGAEISDSTGQPITQLDALAFGVHQIDQVHARGIKGANTLHLNLDTGVDPTHPSAPQMEYFFNAYTDENGPEFARDTGTHGTGTKLLVTGIGNPEEGGVLGGSPECTSGAAVVLDGGSGTFAAVMAGMEWAIEIAQRPEWADKMVVVNMSLGAGAGGDVADDPMAQIIERARELGIVFVCANGNSGPGESTTSTPAWAPGAVAIGATDNRGTLDHADDIIARFSSRGGDAPGMERKPNFTGRGVNVRVATPGGGTGRSNGTSFAAPVAGSNAFNLIGSRLQELQDEGMLRKPLREMVRDFDIEQALAETAVDIEPGTFGDGAGDIRIADALEVLEARFSRANIQEREDAFRFTIKSAVTDDGVISAGDSARILRELSKLADSLTAPEDRIEFLNTTRKIADEFAESLDPTTLERIHSSSRELLAQSALQLCDASLVTSGVVTMEHAASAWSTLVAARSTTPNAEQPMGGLSAQGAQELQTLILTMSQTLAPAEQLAFLEVARSEVMGQNFDGGADVRAALFDEARDAFKSMAKDSTMSLSDRIGVLGKANDWLQEDNRQGASRKGRELIAIGVNAVRSAPADQRLATAEAFQRLAHDGTTIDSNWLRTTADKEVDDARLARTAQGFQNADEALTLIRSIADSSMERILAGGTVEPILTSVIRTARSSDFMRETSGAEEFHAGISALLESLRPNVSSDELNAGYKVLRLAMLGAISEARNTGLTG